MTRTQYYKKQLDRLNLCKEEYYWYLYFWHAKSGLKGFCMLIFLMALILSAALWGIMP